MESSNLRNGRVSAAILRFHKKKKKKNFALFVCWFVESRKDDRREARAKRVRTWYCTVAVFNKVGGCEFDSRDLN